MIYILHNIHFFGVLKVKNRFFSECYNVNIFSGSLSKSMVFGWFFVLLGYFLIVGLYIFLSWFGTVILHKIILQIKEIFYIGLTTEMTWLLYGLIFGVGFSFLVQGLPRKEVNNTPKLILNSLSRHLVFFTIFYFCLIIWFPILLIIVRYVQY